MTQKKDFPYRGRFVRDDKKGRFIFYGANYSFVNDGAQLTHPTITAAAIYSSIEEIRKDENSKKTRPHVIDLHASDTLEVRVRFHRAS